MGERVWIQYEYVMHPSGTLWKNFAYIFSTRKYMGNVFHNDIAPNHRMPAIYYRKLLKNPIRYGEFIPWKMIPLKWHES
jgi:hypothetical protein